MHVHVHVFQLLVMRVRIYFSALTVGHACVSVLKLLGVHVFQCTGGSACTCVFLCLNCWPCMYFNALVVMHGFQCLNWWH